MIWVLAYALGALAMTYTTVTGNPVWRCARWQWAATVITAALIWPLALASVAIEWVHDVLTGDVG